MKHLRFITLAIVASVLFMPANAQFLNRLIRSAGNAAENAVQSNVNRQIDRAIDDAFEGKQNESKKSKKDRKQQDNNQEEQTYQQQQSDSYSQSSQASSSQGWHCPSCGNTGNTGKFCNECGTKRPEEQSSVWTCPSCGHEGNTGKFCDECGTKRDGTKQADRATSEWNKFDFVPGDEVIFYDQLENEQLGEFPSKWELIGGEAEIQKLNGENVIALMDGVRIMPLIEPMWNYLPDVYTIEFDYYEALEKEGENYGDIEFKVMPENEHDLYHELWRVNFPTFINEPNLIHYKDDNKTIHTYFRETAITTGQYFDNDNRLDKVEYNKWHHISISVNKRAVKIYYDETRVANIPNYQNPNGGYFGFHYAWAETQYPLYIKNVRFAKGAKPLYDRMMTDGKFITYGITFDVGKAIIKPESMGEINRIVKLMTDDPSLKFEVQGHTDNTGNAASNQTLSEQRAQAIVQKLVEMGISADRLTAVGKGQTNPLADNSTDKGRAKNRRVEFIKQ
ncbi:MAG: OmpA family protein [Paludibacteraceae bacterium]|nr:OmpA family protein [Paludibacteraceae bacterium]